MPTTPGGLRYPTTQDLLADTAAHIRNLETDINNRLSKISYVQRAATAACTGGAFSLSITDFVTLRGVVIMPLADPNNTYMFMVIIRGITSQGMTGELWYMDRDREGAEIRAAGGNFQVNYIAWGDPK